MTHRVQDFDFSVDLLRAVLWQYDGSPRLLSLLTQKHGWYTENQTEFWENWIRDVFDLRTANDFGLAVWARILNIPLVAGVPGSGDREVFGFDPYGLNFNQGNFGRDQSGTLGLSIEQKRMILRLRYFQLISRGTVPEANFVLGEMFGAGEAFVLDALNMTAVYVFKTPPSSQILFVLQTFDLMPRPAGVGISTVINPGSNFGFDPYYQNFENGTFGG